MLWTGGETAEVTGRSAFNASNMTNSTPYEEDDARWCYEQRRAEVCVRISVLLAATTITGICLLLRVIQYHWYRSKSYNQYIIYYAGLLLAILSLIHWAYVSSSIIDFITTFLIVFQLLVISHFFCYWAARILHMESIYMYIVGPALVVILVYFFSVTLWASFTVEKDSHECTQPQWLLFSASQLILVQLFLAAVIYISRKLNTVRTARSNRLSQKAQLWGLAIVYELVSIVTFCYDLALLITKSKDDDCQTFFTSNNIAIVVIYIAHGTVKYLLPQWGIISLFSPLKPATIRESTEESLSWARKPNYQSTFYHTSYEEPDEKQRLIPTPYSINHGGFSSSSSYTGAILPRATSSHSASHYSSPWLKTRPGQTFPTQQALES